MKYLSIKRGYNELLEVTQDTPEETDVVSWFGSVDDPDEAMDWACVIAVKKPTLSEDAPSSEKGEKEVPHPKLPPIEPDENRPEELRRNHENTRRTGRAL